MAECFRTLANRLNLKPPGAAHLHTELSTTFLYASVDRYLQPDAVVACILPDSVLNGLQHQPFREGAPAASRSPVRFRPSNIWQVLTHVQNKAIVVFGKKATAISTDSIPGQVVSRDDAREVDFAVIRRGDRLVWSDTATGTGTGFNAGEFRQGADLIHALYLSRSHTSNNRKVESGSD